MKTHEFKSLVWGYYRKHKRSFPWRETSDPYFIFVSEVMLQQTQTTRVKDKYRLFIDEFPNFESLAQAPLPKLLGVWQGLGYNRRALYLQKAAQRILTNFGGKLPKEPKHLQTLPGIGYNTACSIIVFSYNLPFPFIETNIRRTFIHHFFKDQDNISDKEILPLVEETIDKVNPREWFYALMDYGATLPKLTINPNRKSKHYTKQSKFEGSSRQVRGQILKALLVYPRVSESELKAHITGNLEYYSKVLRELEKEGFIKLQNGVISLLSSPEKQT